MALLLGVFAVLGGCDGSERASLTPGAKTDIGGAAEGPSPECDEQSCRALDTECSRGTCSPSSDACISVPRDDGEPCAPANPCGDARCVAGSCIPSSPPDCSALDDECHVGVCSVTEGCTARAVGIGLRCEDATTLAELASSPSASVDTRCGSRSAELAACGAPAGNAAFFELDLTNLELASPVALLLGAEHRIESALLRGDCADPALIACGRRADWFGDPGGVELREVLEPGRYWVVAASTDPDAVGPIQLAASLDAITGDSDGRGARCDDPLPLEPDLNAQVEWGATATAERGGIVDCDDYDPQPGTYYALDLSRNEDAALVQIELDAASWGALTVDSTGEACGKAIECGRRFSGVLEPGRYLLGVESSSSPDGPFAFKVITTTCGAMPNDSCANAFELDPTATPQRVRGDTACGDYLAPNDWSEAETPHLFYRLDLTGHDSPVAVVNRRTGEGASIVIVEAGSGTTCGPVTACCHDFLLAPRLYYLAVQSSPPQAFELELELRARARLGPTDCIPRDVIRCAQNSTTACHERGLNDPRCVGVLEECGLEWAPLARLCASAPECCEQTATSDSAGVDCEALFLQAGGRCPECVGAHCWF